VVCRCVWSRHHKNPREWGGRGPLRGYRAKRKKSVNLWVYFLTLFSNSPPRATYPQIFSRLSTSIYAHGEAVEPNLKRLPYAPTSVTLHNNLHPIKSPALTIISTPLISYFFIVLPRHSLMDIPIITSTATPTPNPGMADPITFPIFSQFFGPFWGAPGALALYFRIPLLPLHVPIFFPTFKKIPPWRNAKEKVESPRPGMADPILLTLPPNIQSVPGGMWNTSGECSLC